jgi:hypothetical protein
MISRIPFLVTLFCLSLHFTVVALAIEPLTDPEDRLGPLAQANAPTSDSGQSARASVATIPPEAEAIEEAPLLEFVEQHQPSLLKLLRFMKKKQPQQYEQAIKELSRVKQRLANLEKRDAESYVIELELWQVRSKLRMLVAEILVSPQDSQEKLKMQLHGLVQKEVDLDSARLQLEQKRIAQRLAQVQSQLEDRTADRAATLSKAIKTWENRAFKSSRPKKQSAK